MESWLFRSLLTVAILTFALVNYWFLGSPVQNYGSFLSTQNSKFSVTTSFRDTNFVTQAPDNNVSGDSIQHTKYVKAVTIPNDTFICHDTQHGVVIYGDLIPGYNYTVISSTTHDRNSLGYLFDLPLTALAWKRIGYRTLATIVVISNVNVILDTDTKVCYVVSKLLEQDAVVMFLESPAERAVMTSQVSRLFVANLVGTECINNNDQHTEDWGQTYLVTSDADLWPLKNYSHGLPLTGVDILSLNAHCCGDFTHKGKRYTMLPIGNIGMRVNTWKQVSRRQGFSPVSVDDLLVFFSREFGDTALTPVLKGENVGWFMDQRMISVLIQDWVSRVDGGAEKVLYIKRDTGQDRIDRTQWKPFTLEGKTDSHILDVAYEQSMWRRLEALLVLMYPRETVDWCRQYAETFQSLL